MWADGLPMRAFAETFESELGLDALEALKRTIRTSDLKGLHVEIGTAAGGTIREIISSYEDELDCPDFLVVDPMNYFPNQLETVRKNLSGLHAAGKVQFIVETGGRAYKLFQKDSRAISFLLIDGSHKVKYVCQDAQWINHVEVGGLVCFDDFDCGFIGVDWVVKRYVLPTGCFEHLGYHGRLLLLRRIKAGRTPVVSAFDLALSHVLHPIFQLRTSILKRLRRLVRD